MDQDRRVNFATSGRSRSIGAMESRRFRYDPLKTTPYGRDPRDFLVVRHDHQQPHMQSFADFRIVPPASLPSAVPSYQQHIHGEHVSLKPPWEQSLNSRHQGLTSYHRRSSFDGIPVDVDGARFLQPASARVSPGPASGFGTMQLYNNPQQHQINSNISRSRDGFEASLLPHQRRYKENHRRQSSPLRGPHYMPGGFGQQPPPGEYAGNSKHALHSNGPPAPHPDASLMWWPSYTHAHPQHPGAPPPPPQHPPHHSDMFEHGVSSSSSGSGRLDQRPDTFSFNSNSRSQSGSSLSFGADSNSKSWDHEDLRQQQLEYERYNTAYRQQQQLEQPSVQVDESVCNSSSSPMAPFPTQYAPRRLGSSNSISRSMSRSTSSSRRAQQQNHHDAHPHMGPQQNRQTYDHTQISPPPPSPPLPPPALVLAGPHQYNPQLQHPCLPPQPSRQPQPQQHFSSPAQLQLQQVSNVRAYSQPINIRGSKGGKRDIKRLQEMGFELDAVLDALQHCKGDVEAAANHLANCT